MREWRQIQRILDKLSGTPHLPTPAHHLDEPWRTIYTRLEPPAAGASRDEQAFALWQAATGLLDQPDLVSRLLATLPDPDAAPTPFPSLHDLAPDLPPIDWLWPGWVPRGLLTLLGAAPGAGKSLVALDLARRLIHGDPLPDGTPVPTPGGNVVYVDAEAIPQILHQRAAAWRIDLRRLYLMLPPAPYGFLDLCDADQQDTLVQMLYELQPHLVVVDSLSSITLRGENNVEDVRAILTFLAAVAREFDLALLLVHHLRKRGKGLPAMDLVTADDFRGSSHIIAMARSVLALSIIQEGAQPDRNGPRRLEIVKTNLCAYPPPLGLHFEATDELPQGAGDQRGAPILAYGAPPQPYTGEPTQAEQCAAWLVAVLEDAGAPMRPKEIMALAEEAGYTRGVVYRARKELGDAIQNTHPTRSPHNRWALGDADEA